MDFNQFIQWLRIIVDWIGTNSDLFIVAATIAIAYFTYTLYRATSGMLRVAREQSNDMKTSIAASQQAADAAKKSANAAKASADALPAIERAYIFVKVQGNIPNRIVGDYAIYELPPKLSIIATNYGKTPAIIVDIRDIIFCDKCDIAIYNIVRRITSIPKSEIPSGTVIIDSGDKRQFDKDIILDAQQWDGINNLTFTVFCVGRIKYEDIFSNIHETVFCWQYEQFTGFKPVENPECNYHT